MFKKILNLLEQHRRLSLRELSSALNSQPEAVEPIMELLVKKGKAQKVSFNCSRGSCSGCVCSSREDVIIFEPV